MTARRSSSSRAPSSTAPPRRSTREPTMQLLEDDEAYLREKAHDWQLEPDGNGAYLIIRNYPISAAVFDREKVDLMIRIPAGYNNAALDMFYVDPELKLRKTGAHPEA